MKRQPIEIKFSSLSFLSLIDSFKYYFIVSLAFSFKNYFIFDMQSYKI